MSKYERPINVWEENHLINCNENGLFKNKKVLELGGITPKSYVDKFGVKSWTCVDKQWNASENSTYKKDNYKVIISDILEQTYEDEHYDTVISTHMLEHLLQIEKTFNMVYKTLKPNGQFSALYGPIWSCHKGHHIWVKDDNNDWITYNDGIIPEYAHLLYNEEEFKELMSKKYSNTVINNMSELIYHSKLINRVFAEDYVDIINKSAFKISELRNWHKPVYPDAKTQKLLEKKYNKKNFHSISMKFLLQK